MKQRLIFLFFVVLPVSLVFGQQSGTRGKAY